MTGNEEHFPDVATLLSAEHPKQPVYCIFPHVFIAAAKQFLEGFPGRVLYAVKANADPTVLKLLIESGISHFDCASLPEIEIVHTISPDSKKYFMIPRAYDLQHERPRKCMACNILSSIT